MKKTVLTLVIGILIGAVLASAGLLIYFNAAVPESNGVRPAEETRRTEGNPPEKPNGSDMPPVPTDVLESERNGQQNQNNNR